MSERRPTSYIVGDEVLVPARVIEMYGPFAGDSAWLRVVKIAPGTAAAYPIKVQLPHGGVGQLREEEVLGHRRPDGFRAALDEHVMHMGDAELDRVLRERNRRGAF